MLTNRKNLILKIIVEEYVQTAEPVGSRTLSKLEELNCSSATIRNEMADLEDMGFLEKTHTSSGRIPSEQGYRYYIEHLINFDESEYFDEIDLEEIFSNKNSSTEEIIDKTISMISDLTNYTSIVLGPNGGQNRIKKVEFVPLGITDALIIIVTDSGHIENKRVYLENGLEIDKMSKVVEVINKTLYDCKLDLASEKLKHAFTTDDLLNYLDFKDKLFDLFVKVFDSFARDKVYVKGQYNLINEPEFNDIDAIKGLVEVVESQKFLSLLDSNDNETCLKVTIGSENNVEFMENCTLITVPYYTKNNEVGKIAVVGPKRMNYKKVIPLLNYIAKNMTKLD